MKGKPIHDSLSPTLGEIRHPAKPEGSCPGIQAFSWSQVTLRRPKTFLIKSCELLNPKPHWISTVGKFFVNWLQVLRPDKSEFTVNCFRGCLWGDTASCYCPKLFMCYPFLEQQQMNFCLWLSQSYGRECQTYGHFDSNWGTDPRLKPLLSERRELWQDEYVVLSPLLGWGNTPISPRCLYSGESIPHSCVGGRGRWPENPRSSRGLALPKVGEGVLDWAGIPAAPVVGVKGQH
ncbi:hypothetical protein ACVWY9_002581 [Thermostichus sp. OS-CIW-31]